MKRTGNLFESIYAAGNIRKYFDSIDQDVLKNLLARQIKDRDVFALFNTVFDTYMVETGKGLPIGNLISQHMANFYLKYRSFERNLANGQWCEEDYVRHMEPLVGFTKTANAGAFRNNVIKRFGVSQ